MSQAFPSPRPPLTYGRLWGWFLGLLCVTILVGFTCSFVGIVHVPLPLRWLAADASPWTTQVWQIWTMRVCRLLVAAGVGAGLATAGMALQALLRNPLAEPYVLGISSGAGVCVLAGSLVAHGVFLPDWATTPALASLGALLTSLVVYGVAQPRGRLDPYMLLLAGVMVNVFNGALVVVILQFVDQEELVRYIGWGMGDIPDDFRAKPTLLAICLALVLLGWLVLFCRGAAFNTLGLGEEVAASSGVRVDRLRFETFTVVSLMTAAAVALAGPIGFVGLMVPHICRNLVGPDHRRLAIVSGFGGAIFLMLADTCCRVAGEPFGLGGGFPVGVVTALSGGPFFVWLLRRRLKGGEA